jgi:ubiquinone biosynthesis protein COQ4
VAELERGEDTHLNDACAGARRGQFHHLSEDNHTMTAQGEVAAPAEVPASAKVTARPNRIRPFEAVRALARLSRDPEDTRQVFIAMAALRGNSGLRFFQRFVRTPVGAAVLVDRRKLMDPLDDQAALARLPDGSLGRAYLAFMQQENLSAAGLMQVSEDEDLGLGADGRLVRDRERDMHDLTHVVTGYGRDLLGEICLQAFMYRQTGNRGSLVIVIASVVGFLGSGRARKAAGADLVARGVVKKAGKAMVEAFFNGRKGAWLPGLDWESLLVEDLQDLRRRLGVPAPATYLALQA